MRASRWQAVALALALASSLAACGSNVDGGLPAPPAAAPTPSATMKSPNTPTATPAPPRTTGPRPSEPNRCTEPRQWGTSTKAAGPEAPIQAEIYSVRTGRHDDQCYDQITFDINGYGPVSYVARYVRVVGADASDQPVPVKGGAALQVTIRAPDFASSGHQPWRKPWLVGQVLFESGQWHSLRQIKFAGSFEAHTTFAVGVRAKQPFEVSTWQDGTTLHVIVKIAQ